MFIFRFIGKLIKFVIKAVFILLMIVVLLTASGYVLIREQFDVDPYDAVKYAIALNEQVDETVLCPNAFTDEDMQEVQSIVNTSVADMVTYSEDTGYAINFETLTAMSDGIKLSDRQLGVLAQETVEQETEGKIQAGDYVLGFELKQIDVSNVKNGDAEFNCVIKLDISSIKETLKSFPLKYLKDVLPDNVYVSSTVYVERGETDFDYVLSHRAFTINNLDDFKTEDLFRTLNILAGVGTAEELNLKIGEAVFGVLIGNDEQKGLVYSLKDEGASGFEFVEEEGIQYFKVNKSEPVTP